MKEEPKRKHAVAAALSAGWLSNGILKMTQTCFHHPTKSSTGRSLYLAPQSAQAWYCVAETGCPQYDAGKEETELLWLCSCLQTLCVGNSAKQATAGDKKKATQLSKQKR
uniref:Uncharacterized protein n=1 Tax=Coturnix japonica TaxID=93934 RepID=A0A8C2TUZ3_COTJA